MNSEKVSFQTKDKIEIFGLYFNGGHNSAAILLHMMPATKESWIQFAQELDRVGFNSIAIDFRGHGESTMSGKLDYHLFSDSQHQEKIFDVEAVFDFVKTQGVDESQIIIVGASIGANLAIEFLADHPMIKIAIALSPGLDYHGVKTDLCVSRLQPDQKLLIVTSDDDPESASDSRTLYNINPNQILLVEKHNIGHGTNMFKNDPKLIDELIEWIKK